MYAGQDCSLARALEAVGERWTLLVLRDCFYGVVRFNDFQAHLDISRPILAERLKALINEGLLERRHHGTGNRYVLTEKGTSLWPAVFTLAQWGEQHFGQKAGPRRIFVHANCDTRLDPSGLCPACNTVPGPADLMVHNGPGVNDALRDDPVTLALQRGPHRLLTPLATAPNSTTPV
jgi:DNA-binding HxlR family transcriptional regulator